LLIRISLTQGVAIGLSYIALSALSGVSLFFFHYSSKKHDFLLPFAITELIHSAESAAYQSPTATPWVGVMRSGQIHALKGQHKKQKNIFCVYF